MYTIQQWHCQSVGDSPVVLLASPCADDLGLGVASVLAQFSVKGHS